MVFILNLLVSGWGEVHLNLSALREAKGLNPAQGKSRIRSGEGTGQWGVEEEGTRDLSPQLYPLDGEAFRREGALPYYTGKAALPGEDLGKLGRETVAERGVGLLRAPEQGPTAWNPSSGPGLGFILPLLTLEMKWPKMVARLEGELAAHFLEDGSKDGTQPSTSPTG